MSLELMKNEPLEEFTTDWEDIPANFQLIIVQQSAKFIKTRKIDTLYRLFNMANPKIVLIKEDDRIASFKVQNSEVLTLLVKNYL